MNKAVRELVRRMDQVLADWRVTMRRVTKQPRCPKCYQYNCPEFQGWTCWREMGR
jgi:hypothetical protein